MEGRKERERGRDRERERGDIALSNLIQVAFLLCAYVLNVGHALGMSICECNCARADGITMHCKSVEREGE